MKQKRLAFFLLVLLIGIVKNLNATNIEVSNLNNNGTGSLRWAIGSAAIGDTISFSVTGTILIDSVIVWNKNLTILGPGIAGIVLDGNNASCIFQMTGGNNIVRNISFKNGLGGEDGGGCIYSPAGNTSDTTILENCSFKYSNATQGGAIHCSDFRYLIMRNCIVDSCISSGYAGGILASYGAMLDKTTISNCYAEYGGGAAWINNNVSNITNCTFVNNTAYSGGAIYFEYQSTILLMNNTFSGNNISSSGGSVYAADGMMFGGPSITFQNNIFNCTLNNYNQSSTLVTTVSNGGNISNDLSMSSFLTASHDQNNTNPLLDPAGLKNNGGTIPTLALTASSPAVNNGINYNAPLIDSRGYSRNGQTDVGAYEFTGMIPCLAVYSSITVSNCGIYSSPSGNYTWTTNGVYHDTISLPGRCDSVITINLTINMVEISVIQLGAQLVSAANGASFQWLNCDAGYSIIGGETGQSFLATTNGNYAVEVKKNGCIDTSACYVVITVGIIENDFGVSLMASPNPTQNRVNINLGKTYNEVKIKVMNDLGQIVTTNQFHTVQQFNLELPGSQGCYFLEVESDTKERAYIKILKY